MAWWIGLVVFAALAWLSAWAWRESGRNWANLWLTPDQQGARQFARGDFSEAGQRFLDSRWQGMAFFRAGKFKEAAAAFARENSPEGCFNRGDALVMLGDYPGAIASYTRALQLRPGWREAEENRALAAARDKLMHPPNDGSENTDSDQEPDKIIFDLKKNQPNQDEQKEVVTGGQLSDAGAQALWLRRVQTKPADFLAAKFAYQLSVQKPPAPAPAGP